jgi:hypothetical protein
MDLEAVIQHHQSEGLNPHLHISYWFMLMILIYWMEAAIITAKEIGPEVNAEKTKYLVVSVCRTKSQHKDR